MKKEYVTREMLATLRDEIEDLLKKSDLAIDAVGERVKLRDVYIQKLLNDKRPMKFKFATMHIGKLNVQPGDILVLCTDLHLDKEQSQFLYERATEHFKDLGVKISILGSGLKVCVLRKEKKKK